MVNMVDVPIWEKYTLSLEEAAAYSGIGRDRIRKMADEPGCKFVVWSGNRRLIKRRLFEEFIDQAYSI
jgi:excisionase family DNA binding protein